MKACDIFKIKLNKQNNFAGQFDVSCFRHLETFNIFYSFENYYICEKRECIKLMRQAVN